MNHAHVDLNTFIQYLWVLNKFYIGFIFGKVFDCNLLHLNYLLLSLVLVSGVTYDEWMCDLAMMMIVVV